MKKYILGDNFGKRFSKAIVINNIVVIEEVSLQEGFLNIKDQN